MRRRSIGLSPLASDGFVIQSPKVQWNELEHLLCLAAKQRTDEESLPSETLPEEVVTCFLEDNLRYRNAESAVAR